MIYLDNAASTEPSNEVYKMFNDYCGIYSNPSSIHSFGREAFGIIDNARKIFRNKLNADQDDQILFTSGATMSNNVFIQGFMNRYPKAALIVSKIEHKDILLLADYLKLHNRDVYYIPVHQDGRICMDVLEDICFKMKKQNKRFLCSIQAANGECGVIQDYIWISKIVHMYGGIYHSDVTQYIPYYPIDISCLDAFSMSGQKIHCFKGTGLLYIKKDIEIDPVIFGEQGLIGGTENVLGIACLGEAFGCLTHVKNNYMCQLRDKMFNALSPYGRILGSIQYRLPNNVYMSFDRPMVTLLNNHGIMTSAGSACAKTEPSHVILVMGYDEQVARNAVRFSLSNRTTEEEIDKAINITKEVLWIKEDKADEKE